MSSAVLNRRIADRFALECLAGTGGMGAVYRARDELTGGVVAVKLLQDTSDGEPRARFMREAQVLAELDHPNIVRHVTHGVTEENKPFLVMEWLDGEDLAKRLLRGPMSLSETMILARRVADGLSFAHARGIVHRDIKPSNIFLRGGSMDDIAILDFGIAHMHASTRPLTATGVVVGTPAYMAPEQARAEREVGPPADVFSLGCILYECIAGVQAFSGGNMVAILAKILFADPPRLHDIRNDIPDSVDALLRRMLVREPARRLSDGTKLIEALETLDISMAAGLGATMGSRIEAGDVERRLISVLVASPPVRPSDTNFEIVETEHTTRMAQLADELRKFGARAEIMADGSLVATLASGRGPATDQAAMAARAALLIKARWPEASIALCTGRGQVHGALPVGDVLDRAATLLRNPAATDTSDYVLLDEVTRGLLGARFKIRETVTGSYALTSEDSTLDPTRPLLGKPTPCVGRESELGMLDLALTGAVDEATPRAVLVIAPPGTGKSRLRHEFVRRVENRDKPPLVLLGQGDPMSAGSAYGMLGQCIRRLASIVEGEELTVRREKLATRVAKNLRTDVSRVTAFLGEMCGIPFDDDEPKLRAARQDPLVMADQVSAAFIDFLRVECQENPLLIVLEDLHWSDALTVKLVEAALRDLEDLPLLVLALARPEVTEVFPKLWNNQAQVVVLRPLSRKAGEKLVRQVLGASIGLETMSRILEQSEGNALFLEELIRNFAEGHGDEAPPTVLAMLQARIGRLEPHVRKVLRCASVFGESAWLGGIRRLLTASTPAVGLDDALRALGEAEILELRRESRFQGEQEYRFRHALTRDAAYELLTDEERVSGHRLAAEYLEEVREQDSLIIAEHFVQGNQPKRAIPHFVRAVEQSCDNGDMRATVATADRALALDPDAPSRGAFLAAKAEAYVWWERYAELMLFAEEALTLLEPGGLRWCQLMQHIMPAAAFTGQTKLLFELGEQLGRTDPKPEAVSRYIAAVAWLSISCGIMGLRKPCEMFLARVEQVGAGVRDIAGFAAGYMLATRANHHHLVYESQWQAMVCNRDSCVIYDDVGLERLWILGAAYHSKALMDLGFVQESEDVMRKNLVRAEQINEEMSLIYAKTYLARHISLHGRMENLDEAVRLAEQIIATKNQSLVGLAFGVLAEVAKRRGDLTLAEVEARKAVAATQFFPTYSWDQIAQLVMILIEMKRPEEALAEGQTGLDKLEALDVHGFGEIHLRLSVAEALHASGRIDEAHDMLGKTLDQLRLRLEIIPDADARERYVSVVPLHVRLLQLAREWFPAEDVRARIGMS